MQEEKTQDYWRGKIDAYLSLVNKMNGYTNQTANDYLYQRINDCNIILSEIQSNKKSNENRRHRKIKEVQKRIRNFYKRTTPRQRVLEDGTE